jgi:hypothetical protein
LYTQELTGEASLGDALLSLAARLPRARLLFTTQGARGSICLQRQLDSHQQVGEFEVVWYWTAALLALLKLALHG